MLKKSVATFAVAAVLFAALAWIETSVYAQRRSAPASAPQTSTDALKVLQWRQANLQWPTSTLTQY